MKIGMRGSAELASKYTGADAFGFVLGAKSRLTVLDVDTPCERVLADAIDRHGNTPCVVRSASGNWQLWYRHNGEGRRIRPEPDRPIDILGGGFVVAPPSKVTKGRYGFMQGGLDDIGSLPVMRAVESPQGPSEMIGQGQRNDSLWRHCMAQARYCDDLASMMDVAFTFAEQMQPPLSMGEIERTALSAWGYQDRRENWFGEGKRLVYHFDEVDNLLLSAPDAFGLLTFVKRHHGPHPTFCLPNAMHERFAGWGLPRFRKARATLLSREYIVEVQPPTSGYGPALYKLA
jgi:hypothetical protein